MKDIPTIYLCTAVSIISSASYCRQHSLLTDGPTNESWSKLLSGGELEYLEYWQYFVRLVLRVLVLRVLRVLGLVPKYFQYAQYTGSIKFISTIYLCTAVSTILSAFYCRQHSRFTDGPTNGSWRKLLSGRELEYLEYWQYFESICCEHSKYLRVQHSWYSWVL